HRLALGRHLALDPAGPALNLRAPVRGVALVDRVAVAARRTADVRLREEKLSDRRVEREAVGAVTGREDEDGRRTEEDVPGGDDLAPGTERVAERGERELGLAAPEDREDGPDADVRVDVARAVERIEERHVLSVMLGEL